MKVSTAQRLLPFKTFGEPPWDRFLNKPWGRFICPGCGQTLDMHISHGPGTPGTERFSEVA
jgi:hypothetical protein